MSNNCVHSYKAIKVIIGLSMYYVTNENGANKILLIVANKKYQYHRMQSSIV